MVFQNNVLLGAAGSGTTRYAIDQSIRFNDGDSAYMYKDFSGAGNQKQFTISLWLKRSLLGWSYVFQNSNKLPIDYLIHISQLHMKN